MLAQYLPGELFAFMLVFARIGAGVMLLPGIGETYVFRRVRLALALALSFVILPLVRDGLPGLPDTPWALAILVSGEILYGLFIGATTRLMLSALHVAGTVIAFQSSLAYAMTVDPNQGVQGALISALMTMAGVVLIFATGLHMMMIGAIYDSYTLFPPGSPPPTDSIAQLVIGIVASSFHVGIQMAAPFVVFGIAFYIGLGLLQRLMPQVQLFFSAIPLQICFAFVLLMAVLPASMMWFINHFEANILNLMAPN